ncbi:MAG: hypothetical protein R3335_03020 [Anaerolineales bacterium]|nr:hypothetical protein [Anaerolineales bacterium]
MKRSKHGYRFLYAATTVILILAGCTAGQSIPTPSPASSTAPDVLVPFSTTSPQATALNTEVPTSTATDGPVIKDTPVIPGEFANIISVSVSGDAENYSFSVQISSPDEGCSRYADWWEVISEQGELVYRRILLHSHVNEQPFTRSGGPVNIGPDEIVLVRAHMNTGGYGGLAMRGTPAGGFETVEHDQSAFAGLAQQDPLPSDCDF